MELRKFILSVAKFSIVVLAFFLILLCVYIYKDPFKAIRDYDDYSMSRVAVNRDHISTETFLKNHQQQQYNSFLLGSSRVLAISIDKWKDKIGLDNSPYMFDASRETVYGIHSKLQFLDSKGTKLDNVIIFLCRDHSFQDYHDDVWHLTIKHYATSGQNKILYHLEYFKSFLNLEFLKNYIDWEYNQVFKLHMYKHIQQFCNSYDTISNELFLTDYDRNLKENEVKYYNRIIHAMTAERSAQIDSLSRIDYDNKKMLKEIKMILKKHNSDYRIVLSPLFEQIKYHPEDMKLLQQLFGSNLYDFTGANSITNDYHNYYETSHFKKHIGDTILNTLYEK